MRMREIEAMIDVKSILAKRRKKTIGRAKRIEGGLGR